MLIAPAVLAFDNNLRLREHLKKFHATNKANKLSATYVQATAYAPQGSAAVYVSIGVCGYETLVSGTFGIFPPETGYYGGQNACLLNEAKTNASAYVCSKSGDFIVANFIQYSDKVCSMVHHQEIAEKWPQTGKCTTQNIKDHDRSATLFNSLTSSTVTQQRLKIVAYVDNACTQGYHAIFAATKVCIAGVALLGYYYSANSYKFNNDGSKLETLNYQILDHKS